MGIAPLQVAALLQRRYIFSSGSGSAATFCQLKRVAVAPLQICSSAASFSDTALLALLFFGAKLKIQTEALAIFYRKWHTQQRRICTPGRNVESLLLLGLSLYPLCQLGLGWNVRSSFTIFVIKAEKTRQINDK